jgi:hypothetical protein
VTARPKCFNLARVKYRVTLAQAKLDSAARDKGKAKAANEKEVAQEENPYGLHTVPQKKEEATALSALGNQSQI